MTAPKPMAIPLMNINDLMREILADGGKRERAAKTPAPAGPVGYADPASGVLYASIHEPTRVDRPGVTLLRVADVYVRMKRGAECKDFRIVAEENDNDCVYLCDGERAGFFTLLTHAMAARLAATPKGATFKYRNMTFLRKADAEARALVEGKIFAYRDVIGEQADDGAG